MPGQNPKSKIQNPTWDEERACHAQGYTLVAGCDEVGRGAWAGPLIAAAVIFPPEFIQVEEARQAAGDHPHLRGVRDSKELTPAQRETLAGRIRAHALAVGVGLVSAGLGDRIGWGRANRLALVRAVRALAMRPDYLLLDAFALPGLALPQQPIIRGDALCLSIAAASIIAKVTRDQMLVELGSVYPAYGFAIHKGYGTAVHAAALAAHGPSPLHRRSFAPLRALAARATLSDLIETEEEDAE